MGRRKREGERERERERENERERDLGARPLSSSSFLTPTPRTQNNNISGSAQKDALRNAYDIFSKVYGANDRQPAFRDGSDRDCNLDISLEGPVENARLSKRDGPNLILDLEGYGAHDRHSLLC